MLHPLSLFHNNSQQIDVTLDNYNVYIRILNNTNILIYQNEKFEL